LFHSLILYYRRVSQSFDTAQDGEPVEPFNHLLFLQQGLPDGSQGFFAGIQRFNDCVNVEHAATPGTCGTEINRLS
jgi:hypothetical protein